MSDAAINFLSGLFAGTSQVFVMQPFEIIKVRLQTQSLANPQYSGIVDCLTKIVKNEGPLALYKGTLTPLLGVGFLGSIRFGFYQNFKALWANSSGSSTSPKILTLKQKMGCAFVAGCITSFFVCPVQHTRIRIQIQKSAADKIYTGSFDAAVKIFKQYGFKGINRGQGPTLVRQGTGLCCYFTVIQYLTAKLSIQGVKKEHQPLWVPMVAGGLGGTSYWVINYPFDYVKTLMQSDKFGEFKYKNMLDCFKQSYQENGLKTFYKGYIICMMRSFPVNAAALITFRICSKLAGVTTH